jgi:hypothetical protein
MTTVKLPEQIKTREVRKFTPEQLERILATPKELGISLRHHILWTQELQQVQRYDEAQVHLDLISHILNTLENKDEF